MDYGHVVDQNLFDSDYNYTRKPYNATMLIQKVFSV